MKDILWKKRYIRVVIDRTASHTLFEAITKRLESLAEQSGALFGSRDVEAFTPYDPTAGMRAVQFSFWGDATTAAYFSFEGEFWNAAEQKPVRHRRLQFG